LGKNERDAFEAQKSVFSGAVRKIYDDTDTYHDGKWLMFHLEDGSLFEDIKRLLFKRKPNKK
jgi:hypothetical protein